MQGNLSGVGECHPLHGIGTVKTNNHFVPVGHVWEGGSEAGLKHKHACLKGGRDMAARPARTSNSRMVELAFTVYRA